MQRVTSSSPLVRWYSQIGLEDLASVGGKNASLGEMARELAPTGVRVPDGFAVTAGAYRHFLASADLADEMNRLLAAVDVRDIGSLRRCGAQIRELIGTAKLPEDLCEAIADAYHRLGNGAGEPVDVAVRSSATAEDLPDASFAGQQQTYLHVRGIDALLEAVRRCFASLFTDRAISYRADKHFDHSNVALSVGVQRMVRSDLGSSGVMFTIDTETGFRDAVLINAAYGLGEDVVLGLVNPDEFCVFKPTLKAGFRPILQKRLGNKEMKLVYQAGGDGPTVRNVPVPVDDQRRFALSDEEILQLARWACVIEDHYSAKRGQPTPMDIEWAKDGITGEMFIVQARPETVQSQKRRRGATERTYKLREHGPLLITGRSVGEAIATGPARVILDPCHLERVRQGDVLVTDKTDPDWEPVMKCVAAIVTNRGGRTCHAAIVSRELGLPAVVGCERATTAIADGQMVTVCCAEGEAGAVYEGELAFDVEERPASSTTADAPRPRTKIMMNVGNPEEAFALAEIPNDGVGLAREEFIISNYIKVHPLALLEYEALDVTTKASIEIATRGYGPTPEFFVDKLAEGAGMIAAAFYPKDVILRLSDFKTNEYAGLLGGAMYEPQEENPMLGFRGASRYYDPRYRDAFTLECRAVRKVRQEMGLTNLKVMVPFCRTVEEGRRVLAEMERHGLKRGQDGLEVYVMCEIPSNVILAEQFAEIFDGFSIGSNDLTQLTLGVDRDSEVVAHVFDERNEAVKRLIRHVIKVAREHKRKIGICGQAPSDYPDFAAFLVEQGIDSISLNPDAVLKTTAKALETENALHQAKSTEPAERT